jgi:hypothetical protein
MQEPARVGIVRRLEIRSVEEVFTAVDHLAEHALHVATSSLVVADRDRLVEAADQLVHLGALPDHRHEEFLPLRLNRSRGPHP